MRRISISDNLRIRISLPACSWSSKCNSTVSLRFSITSSNFFPWVNISTPMPRVHADRVAVSMIITHREKIKKFRLRFHAAHPAIRRCRRRHQARSPFVPGQNDHCKKLVSNQPSTRGLPARPNPSRAEAPLGLASVGSLCTRVAWAFKNGTLTL